MNAAGIEGDINQCPVGADLREKGIERIGELSRAHGRRDAEVEVAVLPLLLMLMSANQFIYIYL